MRLTLFIAVIVGFCISFSLSEKMVDMHQASSDLRDHAQDEKLKQILEDEHFIAVSKEYKLSSKKVMSKKTYKKFFLDFILHEQDFDKKEIKMFKKVINKMSKDVPEEFPVNELYKYTDESRFSVLLDEIAGVGEYDEGLKKKRDGDIEDDEESKHHTDL